MLTDAQLFDKVTVLLDFAKTVNSKAHEFAQARLNSDDFILSVLNACVKLSDDL